MHVKQQTSSLLSLFAGSFLQSQKSPRQSARFCAYCYNPGSLGVNNLVLKGSISVN